MKQLFTLLLLFVIAISATPTIESFQNGYDGLGIKPVIGSYKNNLHDDKGLWINNYMDTTYTSHRLTYFDYESFKTVTTQNSNLQYDTTLIWYELYNCEELLLQTSELDRYQLYRPATDECFTFNGFAGTTYSLTSPKKANDTSYWFSIYSGSGRDSLLNYDLVSESWAVYDTSNSTTHMNNITDLFTDSHGNLWVTHRFTSPKVYSAISRLNSSGEWYAYYGNRTSYDPISGTWVTSDTVFTDFKTTINDIVTEDSSGNVWFANYGVITRFDGEKFYNYEYDTTAYTATEYSSVFEDIIISPNNDSVWFSGDVAMAVWDGDTLLYYNRNYSFPHLDNAYKFIDNNGDKWIDTTDWREESDDYPTKHAVYDGNSWFFLDTCSWWDSVIEDNMRWAYAYNPNGGFWFRRSYRNSDSIPYNTLFYVDRSGYKEYNFYNTGLTNDTISAIASTNEYHYFAHNFGVSYRSRADSSWNCWSIDDFVGTNNFLIDSISAMSVDQSDNVWVGTNSTYSEVPLAKYDGVQWRYFDTTQIHSSQITSVTTNESSVWIGSEKGVTLFNGTEWTLFDTIPSVKAVSTSANGTLFCATDSGAWRYDGSWTNLVSGAFTSVAVDTHGVAWFALVDKGVVTVTDNRVDTITTENSSLASNMIYTITADQFGNIWAGSPFGVSKWDGTNWSLIDSSNSALQANDITSIAIDRDGSKWFGTKHNGIAHLRDDDSLAVAIHDSPVTTTSVASSLRMIGDQLQLTVSESGSATVQLFDLRGRLVFDQRWESLAAGMNVVQLGDLGHGCYIARFSVGDLVGAVRVVR